MIACDSQHSPFLIFMLLLNNLLLILVQLLVTLFMSFFMHQLCGIEICLLFQCGVKRLGFGIRTEDLVVRCRTRWFSCCLQSWWFGCCLRLRWCWGLFRVYGWVFFVRYVYERLLMFKGLILGVPGTEAEFHVLNIFGNEWCNKSILWINFNLSYNLVVIDSQ